MTVLRRYSTIALALTTLAAVLGHAILGHDMIEAAYLGEEGALVAGWVDAEAESLDYYLQRADLHVAWALLMAWIFAGLWWLPRRPLLVSCCLAGFAVATAIFIDVHPAWRRLVTSEPDGALDVATAPTFVLAGLILLVAAIRSPRRTEVVVLLLFACLFLFLGGEEGSWMQKTIDYETPEFVARHNVQNEFNLHNQFSTSVFNTFFQVGVLFFFCVVPLLGRRAGLDARLLRQFGFVLLVYFFLRCLHPAANESSFLSWFFRVAAIAAFGLVLLARRLIDSFLWRPVGWLHAGLRFTPRLLVASCILFGTWLLYGIRFRCLADLSLPGMDHGGNIDSELLEFSVAVLAVLLACDQLPVAEGSSEPDEELPASAVEELGHEARLHPLASSGSVRAASRN